MVRDAIHHPMPVAILPSRRGALHGTPHLSLQALRHHRPMSGGRLPAVPCSNPI